MGGRIACLLFIVRLHSLIKSSREGSKERACAYTQGKKDDVFFNRSIYEDDVLSFMLQSCLIWIFPL